MEYKHSKDFLIDLINQPQTRGWLKDLIINIINNNGSVSNDALTSFTKQLKANSESKLEVPSVSDLSTNTSIRFISLTHHAGVGALADEQIISFSKDITLLYGKNGSGKSSYFRILNEMVGGNHRSAIRSNIYNNTNNPINVELVYAEGPNSHTISWNGTSRAINPLNLSSVFDSSYAENFLQKRSADTAIVLPYGLHLFTALTTAMDNISSNLQTEIENIQRNLPQIKLEGLSDDVIKILTQRDYNLMQRKNIQEKYTISKEHEIELKQLEDQLKDLQKTNFEDKIKLASNEMSQYASLYDYLVNTNRNIKSYLAESKLLIDSITTARKQCDNVKQKISILNEIGNTDTNEWKDFINAGALFVENSHLDKNICPYCRQPIINDAVGVVAAYSTFLSDRSQTVLNELISKKVELKQKLSNTFPSYTITEQFRTIINSRSSSLYDGIVTMLDKQAKQVKVIADSIETEEYNSISLIGLTDEPIPCIKTLCDEYKASIENLRNGLAKKEQTVLELSKKMKPLIELKMISAQKELFIDWFEKIDNIKRIKANQAELSTRQISTIAKNASKTLITENLKNKFQEELYYLGLKNLSVDLSDAGTTRGQSFMQLKLVNNNSVVDVLSEGEQKGVALALFIAERRMQLSNNPIILDDPVNSLDHFITAKLIERLCSLENQIIIFSHNLLLQTSLLNLRSIHECGVNQMSSCRKNSKHLFMYFVKSYGRDKKGVLVEAKKENVANYLCDANKWLNIQPFSNELSIMIGGILRHTIELIIDEKIFKNQIPTKFHGRKNSIQWEQLKTINPDTILIDKLNNLFNRLSGGDLHSGVEQSNNPIDYDELNDIYQELSKIANS